MTNGEDLADKRHRDDMRDTYARYRTDRSGEEPHLGLPCKVETTNYELLRANFKGADLERLCMCV